MENIGVFLAAVLAVCGGISTICAAGNWIVKLVQVFKAPNAQQDRQLATHSQYGRP